MNNYEDLIKFLESRHSVREYLTKSIEEEKRKIIIDLINKINQEHHTNFKVFFDKPEAFKGILLKHWMKDCSNIVVFYHTDPIEAGYYSAEVMLRIQELGLNSCYVGASYQKKLFEVDGLTIQCALAFGYGANQGKPHPNKPVNEIVDTKDANFDKMNEVLKVALSAPSAMNRQRFKLTVKDNKVVPILTDKGFFAEFDFGIVRYYIDLFYGNNLHN